MESLEIIEHTYNEIAFGIDHFHDDKKAIVENIHNIVGNEIIIDFFHQHPVLSIEDLETKDLFVLLSEFALEHLIRDIYK